MSNLCLQMGALVGVENMIRDVLFESLFSYMRTILASECVHKTSHVSIWIDENRPVSVPA